MVVRFPRRGQKNSQAKGKSLSKTFRPKIDCLEDRRMLAKVLLVDDDGAQFRNAAYTSIQEAVDAARAGDTIKVAPGTYAEGVTVNKKLTIQGALAPASRAQDPRFASIVDPPPTVGLATPGFNLLANDVVIQGFSIGDFDGDASPDVGGEGTLGIQTSPSFSGYKLLKNVIEFNTFGIYLNSSGGKPSTVSANTIRNNNEGLDLLPAAGNGIYSDQGARNITISANNITDQSNTAIIFAGLVGTPQEKLTISANQIGSASRNDSGAEILLINVTNSTVKANVLWNSNSHAIDLGGGSSRITIQANVVNSPAFTGINLNTVYSTENFNNQILSNVINGAGDSGIRLRAGTNGTTVKSNVVIGSLGDGSSDPGFGNGISVEDSFNNKIESNTLKSNSFNGIFVDATSATNSLKSNVAILNGEFDYRDDSTGTGTAGTANTWSRNKGQRQNRPGLIS
jgi:parallel beta-helix repeat protein